MNIPHIKQVRQHASAIAVMLVCSFLTILGVLSEQRHMQDRASLHASADATQFQRTLQQGVNSFTRFNRDLAAHFTASVPTSDARGAKAFDIYMQTADVLGQTPGLSYIGYIERTERGADLKQTSGTDPARSYPYLYAYPDDARSRAAKGVDFSAIPERWAAMQQARDSGRTTASAKHACIAGADGGPVVLVFTPIYDPALPASTLAQRRIALRGFVYSIYQIEDMIERVMGPQFHQLFDLEIFDGEVRAEHLLYDGDKRPHVLMQDVDMPIARQAKVEVAGRAWQLFFFPKPIYVQRYHNWNGISILLFGFAVSAALSFLMWIWTRHLLARAQQRTGALQFDAVFENHPSAVYLLDRQRRFVNANAQALKELRVSKTELIGKPAAHFIVPEKRAQTKDRFDETLRGNSVSYDSAIFDGDGARIEISVILIPVKAGIEIISVLGIAQNITAQKRSAWQLQESRKMLQLVIDHIPQRVFWKDTHFKYLGCNVAAARDAGLDSPEQIVGRTDFDLAWRSSADLYRQDDIDTLRSGIAKINYEEQQKRDDGSVSWIRTSKIPLTEMDGTTVAVLGLYEDITDRKDMENQLREMAHYDGLTGLANRAFFHHHLQLSITKSRRSGALLALMYFDVDHFKLVNDSFGHDTGDALLKAFAQRVGATVREMDVFARLGGDEFALLLEDLPSREAAERVAAKLVQSMLPPFDLGQHTISVSTSIGVAFFEHDMRPDDLIRHADQAMYDAKREGRNRLKIASGAGPRAGCDFGVDLIDRQRASKNDGNSGLITYND